MQKLIACLLYTSDAADEEDSFIRKITFQEIRPEGMKNIGPAIEEMAANEHLDAHKNAVTVRLSKLRVEN